MTNLDYYAKHPEELKAAFRAYCLSVPRKKCGNTRCSECREEFFAAEHTEQGKETAITEA